jgi:hypothetical protein
MKRPEFKLKATVSSREDASSYLTRPGDAVIVDRNGPRWLVQACPCGCGSEIPVNLDRRAGPAWRIYRDRNGLSLYPSVWRESGCRSHYIIWRDRILLFDRYDDELNNADQAGTVEALIELVRDRLPQVGFSSFVDVANELDAVPWDVLKACRRLVHAGLACEGRDKLQGSFGRR